MALEAWPVLSRYLTTRLEPCKAGKMFAESWFNQFSQKLTGVTIVQTNPPRCSNCHNR